MRYSRAVPPSILIATLNHALDHSCANALLRAKANPSLPGDPPPLLLACNAGYAPLVKLLLGAQATADVSDKRGSSACAVAVASVTAAGGSRRQPSAAVGSLREWQPSVAARARRRSAARPPPRSAAHCDVVPTAL